MRTKITIAFLLTGLLASFGLLGWRLYQLQFQQSEYFMQTSRRRQNSVLPLHALRGTMVDCRGNVLAASNTSDELFIEPRRLPDPEKLKETAMKLQDIVLLPGPEICRMVYESGNPGYVSIQTGLTFAQRQAVMKLNLPGVGIQNQWRRYYPMGNLTGHVVGFIGAADMALAGLELKYNEILQGQEGQNMFLVDVSRSPIAYRPDQSRPAVDGQSLILTIDSAIQQFTRAALESKMKEYQAESATGIVMSPHTGAILALVSLPDFDPARFNTEKPQRLKNRILTDPYEPGSIIKPIVASIALDTGAIDYKQVFYCEDGYWGKYRIGEFGNHRYGSFTIREILIHSSNIGMAKVGLAMGQKRLYEGMKLFGFGQKTGVDLPGEEPGQLHPISKWSGYTVTRIPFGHEILVNSIQICRAYCILANGGSLVTPYIVRAAVDAQGNMTEMHRPSGNTGFIVKPEVANWIIRKALVGVVEEGTGDKADLDEVQVWGKTGTANIALPTGGYDTSNYIASFVGGAPDIDPKIVVMVSIRKPNRALNLGYSGGRVASPVAGEIIQKTLHYLNGEL
ncbi:MAG: penicillin-binding protein 2 [Planctomycetes bacterium]|nr:penicillin-binding protein 2 [Planctomycetota bacterium]